MTSGACTIRLWPAGWTQCPSGKCQRPATLGSRPILSSAPLEGADAWHTPVVGSGNVVPSKSPHASAWVIAAHGRIAGQSYGLPGSVHVQSLE